MSQILKIAKIKIELIQARVEYYSATIIFVSRKFKYFINPSVTRTLAVIEAISGRTSGNAQWWNNDSLLLYNPSKLRCLCYC